MANSDSPKRKKRKCNERQQLFGPYYLLFTIYFDISKNLYILSGKDFRTFFFVFFLLCALCFCFQILHLLTAALLGTILSVQSISIVHIMLTLYTYIFSSFEVRCFCCSNNALTQSIFFVLFFYQFHSLIRFLLLHFFLLVLLFF